jgi:hypothetical protein
MYVQLGLLEYFVQVVDVWVAFEVKTLLGVGVEIIGI